MNPALQKLIAGQPKDMASRDRLSLKIVRKIVDTAAVPVGFQHCQEISDFEREVGGFPTSDVIATLIREERQALLRSELSKQKRTLERLFRKIAAFSTVEELSSKCCLPFFLVCQSGFHEGVIWQLVQRGSCSRHTH